MNEIRGEGRRSPKTRGSALPGNTTFTV
jgi:hypothetical protein